jgi:hypothetical protein
MIELVKQSCTRQFEAALSQLHNTIALCPGDQWEKPVGEFPFWHVCYHALFYLDFYLSPNEAAFTAQSFHRTDYHHFGFNADGEACTADLPCGKDVLLGYVEHCRRKITAVVSAETAESLAGPSGFWCYKMPRFEFHLNNIRHVHHHAAQLSLHLRRATGIRIHWIGSGWKDQTDF